MRELHLKLLAKAKTLAEGRNRYVHALVVEDFQKNETRLRIRGEEVACNEDEIMNLAMQAGWLVHEMHAAFGDLIALLETLRESK